MAARRTLDLLVSVLFVAGIAAPLARNAVEPATSTAAREERRAAPFPEWDGTLASLLAWPRAYEAWYADRFGLRPELIRLHNRLLYEGLGVSPTREMVRGQGDWIFTTNSHSVPVWRGRYPFGPGELQAWTEVLEERARFCREHGSRYLFVICPNKNSIYPERMPARLQPMGRTRMDELLDYLEAHSDFRLLDLRPALRAAKDDFGGRPIYYPLGTHWNKRGGAVVAHEVLAEAARGLTGLEPWPVSSFRFTSTERQGDSWAARMYLEDRLFQENVDWVFPHPRRARQVELPDARPDDLATEIDDPTLPTAVVFHDSFGQPMQPLFAEHFRRAVQIRTNDFLPEVVERERPDLVLHLMTERGLVAIRPATSPLDTPARLEAELAAGRVLVERAGRRALAPVGDVRIAAEGPGVWRLDLRDRDAGCLLPAFELPDDSWALVAFEVEAPRRTRLWLQFLTSDEHEYTRIGRAAQRELERGLNRVLIELRVPDLAGRLLLRPGSARGQYLLRGLEVRAVPRARH